MMPPAATFRKMYTADAGLLTPPEETSTRRGTSLEMHSFAHSMTPISSTALAFEAFLASAWRLAEAA